MKAPGRRLLQLAGFGRRSDTVFSCSLELVPPLPELFRMGLRVPAPALGSPTSTCVPPGSSWLEWRGRKEEPHSECCSLPPLLRAVGAAPALVPPCSGLQVEVYSYLPGAHSDHHLWGLPSG